MSLLGEFRKRGLFRVAGVYAVAGWFVAQAAGMAEDAFGLPAWFDGAVITVLLLGFPVLMVVSWAFELTPDGLRRAASSPPHAPDGRLARIDIAILAAVVALIGVSAVQILRDNDGAPVRTAETAAASAPAAPQPAPAPAPADLSIAVLPFANMSSDPEQEYFSDGLSEALLNVLAQVRELRVTARTSSFAFKGRNEDVRDIGRQLGVAHILEGSVRKDGGRLLITAQLNSTADGYHLWSQTYDRDLTAAGVFAVQEEIAQAVADSLKITLGLDDIAAGMTDDLEAYDLYLQAQALFQPGNYAPQDILRARDLLRRATARDPGFVNGWEALARVNEFLLFIASDQADVAELDLAERRVRDLAPDSLQAAGVALNRAFRTLPVDWDWNALKTASEAQAARAARQAGIGEVGPAGYLFPVGRAREVAALADLAIAADPLSPGLSGSYQFMLDAAGRPADAEAEYQRFARIAPPIVDTEHLRLLRLGRQGAADPAEFRRRYERYAAAAGGDFLPLSQELLPLLERPEAARAAIARAFDDPFYHEGGRLIVLSFHAASFGDPDLALRALRRIYVDNAVFLTTFYFWLPIYAEMRALPAFKDFLRDVGLVDHWRETGNWGDFCRPAGADDFTCS